jgi:hypothetical protein
VFCCLEIFFFSLLNDFDTLFPVDVLEGDSPSDELVVVFHSFVISVTFLELYEG